MQIKLNVPSVYRCEGVTLKPGVNEVEDEAAEKLLKNRIVRKDIEDGKLETIEAPKKRGPKPTPKEGGAD